MGGLTNKLYSNQFYLRKHAQSRRAFTHPDNAALVDPLSSPAAERGLGIVVIFSLCDPLYRLRKRG